MTEIELVEGQLYWIRCQVARDKYAVFLAEYAAAFGSDWFELIGTDEGARAYKSDVLGRVELVVPDYAKETGYGN